MQSAKRVLFLKVDFCLHWVQYVSAR